MKTIAQIMKKLPAAERAEIRERAARKIAVIRLHMARERTGLTQEDLAKKLGVSQESVSRLEHRPDVKFSNMQRYIEALGGRLEVRAVIKGQIVELCS